MRLVFWKAEIQARTPVPLSGTCRSRRERPVRVLHGAFHKTVTTGTDNIRLSSRFCVFCGCEAGAHTGGGQEQGNRQRNGSVTPPAGRSGLTEQLAFPPRVCCSFVGHGCDFEGETEFRCKWNSSEFRLKLKQSEAYSGQPAQPALRKPASQGAVDRNICALCVN